MRIEYGTGNPGKKALWQGAALLGGAALLSKLVGTLQKIPLQNLAGDEAFGLYSAVYALAVMWMTLASAGIPVAVSALVAERTACGDEAGARRVRRWALGLLVASGLVMFAILWVGAETFADWMGQPSAASAIRMSSIALLFAPAAAVLRGDSQGRMRMLGPAASQLGDQIARVAFMLAALLVAVDAGWSPSATAAAVHGGLAAGAVAGLATMLAFAARERKAEFILVRSAGAKPGFGASGETAAGPTTPATAATASGRRVFLPESRSTLLGKIAKVAVPIAIASIVAPLIGLIDAFSIPRLLRADDAAAGWAMAQFGVYNRGVALLQLVVMGAAGAASALVPALTCDRARGDDAAFTARAVFASRLAWWLGCAAAAGLALLAKPINVALFGDAQGTAAMALIALAAVGGTLQATSAALLQGLGELRAPAVNLAAAALLKLALNVALVPAHGIAGAAAAMAIAYAIAAVLNALSLRARVPLPAPRAGLAGRSVAALAAMAAAVALLALGLGALADAALPARLAALLVAVPGALLGAAVFAAALVAFGGLAPREWRELPGISGTRVDRWLCRLHTLTRREKKEG